MSIANPIKWFHSGMQGAPAMASAFGDMIAVLDACLVNGFNVKTIATITQAGGVATATIIAGHLYLVEQVVQIAGADQAEYNGDQRVNWINGTQFQFAVSGNPAAATTSTSITVKASPLGFQKAFAGANKAAYRSQNALSPKNYLRVNNSQHASWVAGRQIAGMVHMGRSMSDVDTFTGDFAPYSSTSDPFTPWGWYKWHQSMASGNGTSTTNNGATQSPWVLIGDDRAFYFLVAQGGGGFAGRRMYGFGDIESFKAGDQFGTFLWATDNFAESGTASDYVQNYGPSCSSFGGNVGVVGQSLLKGYTGIGTQVAHAKLSLSTQQDITNGVQSGAATGILWPNGPDQSLILHPSYVHENTGHLRGLFPGLYCIHNNVTTNLADLTPIDSVVGYAGRKFLTVSLAAKNNGNDSNPRVAFDLTGPWRS